MDINELKQIIKEEGGKVIFLEEGKPVLVATSFDEYYNKKKKKESEVKANPAIEELKEEVRLEDLPL